MRSAFTSFLAAVLGGGLVAVVAAWQVAERSDVVPMPAAGTTRDRDVPATVTLLPATAPDSGSAPTALVAPNDAILHRLAAIEQRLEALVAASARTPVHSNGGTAVVDASSLQQALEEIERKKIEAMSDAQLRELAWRGAGKGGDATAAMRATDLLLARAKTPEERATWLHQKAVTCRALGGEADLNESMRCLEQVVAENGTGSRAGIEAANQMVWTLSAQKNFAGALRQAESIAQNAGASHQQRLWARWSIALVSSSAGDTLRERAELEALQRELGADPEHEKLLHLVRERLNPTRK